MKRILLASVTTAALAITPALAQTMSTSPSGTAPTNSPIPCVSSNAPAATQVDRSGTGSGGNKPGTTQSSEATGNSAARTTQNTTTADTCE